MAITCNLNWSPSYFLVTAALFFGAYNTVKSLVLPQTSEEFYPLVHMGAACFAEVVSFILRNSLLVNAKTISHYVNYTKFTHAFRHAISETHILAFFFA